MGLYLLTYLGKASICFSDQENHAGVQAKKWNCINEFADSGQNTTFDLINLASSKMAVPT